MRSAGTLIKFNQAFPVDSHAAFHNAMAAHTRRDLRTKDIHLMNKIKYIQNKVKVDDIDFNLWKHARGPDKF